MKYSEEIDAYNEFDPVPISKRTIDETAEEQRKNLLDKIGIPYFYYLERIIESRK